LVSASSGCGRNEWNLAEIRRERVKRRRGVCVAGNAEGFATTKNSNGESQDDMRAINMVGWYGKAGRSGCGREGAI
jgi:hypothetical protein